MFNHDQSKFMPISDIMSVLAPSPPQTCRKRLQISPRWHWCLADLRKPRCLWHPLCWCCPALVWLLVLLVVSVCEPSGRGWPEKLSTKQFGSMFAGPHVCPAVRGVSSFPLDAPPKEGTSPLRQPSCRFVIVVSPAWGKTRISIEIPWGSFQFLFAKHCPSDPPTDLENLWHVVGFAARSVNRVRCATPAKTVWCSSPGRAS